MRIPKTRALLPVCVFAVLGGACVFGADKAEAELELLETKTALGSAVDRLAELEDELKRLTASNEALAKGAAEANLAAAKASEDAELAAKTLEAIGIESLASEQGVAGRLLDALNDLRLVNEENARLRRGLVEISEAVMTLAETDEVALLPTTAAQLKRLVSDANRSLEGGDAGTGFVGSGAAAGVTTVVGIKPELGLVIVNAGRRVGLKEGTPLGLYRDGQEIAAALVVEVRNGISGAIITDKEQISQTVAIGDIARLNLLNSFKN